MKAAQPRQPCVNSALVRFDDGCTNRKPQPAATCVSAARRVCTVERLKHARQVGYGHTRCGVIHINQHMRGMHLQFHNELPWRIRIPKTVVQQVAQQLPYALGIPSY